MRILWIVVRYAVAVTAAALIWLAGTVRAGSPGAWLSDLPSVGWALTAAWPSDGPSAGAAASSASPAATVSQAASAPRGSPAPPPLPLSPVVWGNGSQVTLTFDDFGTPARVSAILDVLARYHVRAIFFPIGSWAGAQPGLIQRMLRDGHLVGNHTYDHAYLPALSAAQIRAEIVHGYRSTLFRPPYGARNATVDRVAAELGYRTVLWTVDTRDWTGAGAATIVATVMTHIRPGGIILMHMHGAHTLEALPAIILGLQSAGYVLSNGGFVPLPAPPSPTAAAPNASPTPAGTPLPSPSSTPTPGASQTASPTPTSSSAPAPSPTGSPTTRTATPAPPVATSTPMPAPRLTSPPVSTVGPSAR